MKTKDKPNPASEKITIQRVEWNEKQQLFHYDSGGHAPNTFGWKTIANHPDLDLRCAFPDAFEAYDNKKKYSPLYNIRH